MTDNGFPSGSVLAGVDASRQSWDAVRMAAWEAHRRGRPLTLVHGYLERFPYGALGTPHQPAVEDVMADARAMLVDVAKRAGDLYPDLSVHTRLSPGGAGVLVDASRSANLVVVGSRGQGGFAGLSIGSVAAQTAAHASCPVLVVRHRDDSVDVEVPAPGPVLVGIDCSDNDEAAIAFAFNEARMRGVPVVAVHVWWNATDVGQPHDQYDETVLNAAAAGIMSEAMSPWARLHPDVAIEHRPVRAMNPSVALIEESAQAGLVVVGCRGRGGFAGLLLGSVSRDLVGHAQTPVAVVHNHP
jgi:nucleotide-binding universal stress UspA family protein